MKTFYLLIILFITIQLTAQEKEQAIKDVKQAAYNYIDTFYKADTTLAYKSVHKDLRKVGWWFDKKKGKFSNKSEMPFHKLIALAKKWNAKGNRANENSIRKINVLEVSDKIAVVKVTAVWGIDYLNMVKTKDGWKSINIIWQSKPKFSLKD
ncbi:MULTISPECIES: nuclear transport factor 2 family protein [unclassified Tenacibaculum]|uniref:nuclear transport factor 2 family protein n=1 Tax=unclassified Tenacibaculum TaxID=2635139 RepID=UPI001F35BBCF|nr:MULTISPECIES: nuclear transport factor 2 family protein [unclassified Tenacibaculum]MCF2874678.1 nuclear transport factor 2 family protein [Tenacibaculum sp. Cn5-1]MCF2934256.1 nuclear transport factor 2 family protein [Tenacibaculum sp. Cn5-34]MCG7510466.1 nuclear transport factor 2 family protein [Tenacibaculum sp. Cn5-46]